MCCRPEMRKTRSGTVSCPRKEPGPVTTVVLILYEVFINSLFKQLLYKFILMYNRLMYYIYYILFVFRLVK